MSGMTDGGMSVRNGELSEDNKRCTTKSAIEAASGNVDKLFDDAEDVVGTKGAIGGDMVSGVLLDGVMIVSGGGIDNTGGIITGLFW